MLGDVRLVGNTATRRDDNIMDISRAVYSPCALCEDQPFRTTYLAAEGAAG